MMSSILYGQLSCGNPNSPASDLEGEQLLNEATSMIIPDTVLKDTDVNVVVSGELEVTDSFQLKQQAEIIKSVSLLKNEYQELEDKEGNYIEEVALHSFLGKEVEFGTLEISTITDSLIRIYADYFDGEPIGGKLFWVKEGALIAVEIVELTKKTTEEGVLIKDDLTYVFYYENNQLFKVVNYQKNEEVDRQNIVWVDENLIDWKEIKQHLNVF